MNRTVPSNRLPVYGALAVIVLLSVAGNLYWVQQNVVQLGHDASAHLTRTLKMAAAMTPLSWNSFLRGLTITDFRPPGLYLAAQPFYALFGRSIDSAQLANIAVAALILVFTFLLADTLPADPQMIFGGDGHEVGGGAVSPRWGDSSRRPHAPTISPRTRALPALLAAGLAALLPMLLAMSRLFYAETLVALCVTAGVYFLIKSGGFARRSWSLALGAALGVGMLAKWTLPVYLAAPLLLAAWFARAELKTGFLHRRGMRSAGTISPLRRRPSRYSPRRAWPCCSTGRRATIGRRRRLARGCRRRGLRCGWRCLPCWRCPRRR